MYIGEVAIKTGISKETLRFYEKIGVIHPSGRSESGYRQFTDDTVPTLKFVRNLKQLGFTLKEIQEFLSLKGRKNVSSKKIKIIIEKKLDEINKKLAAIAALKKTLTTLNKLCDGGHLIEHCPIIRAVEMMEATYEN